MNCENVSAPGRIRTCDTGFRRAVLYPLSYEGVRSELTESSSSRPHSANVSPRRRPSWIASSHPAGDGRPRAGSSAHLLEQRAPLVPSGGRGVVVQWRILSERDQRRGEAQRRHPMALRRAHDFLERDVHRAAPQRDQHTLRAVQRSGVDPRGILYRRPEIHNELPFPVRPRSNIRFSATRRSPSRTLPHAAPER